MSMKANAAGTAGASMSVSIYNSADTRTASGFEWIVLGTA